MPKPSNVCIMLLALDAALGFVGYVAVETSTMPSWVSVFLGLFILALLVGTYYVREFALRAEEKFGWK